MRGRVIGLVVVGLCVAVTLAAVAVALGRDRSDTGAPSTSGRDAVVVIRLDGAITDAMVAPQRAGRENVYALLRRAERDRGVKAVVLRVNSPGGSATASQALYEQIKRVRAAGKKVVVYFADVAASGGYYVGAAGDRIVSQPATITGSIGVIISTIDLSGLYEKVGVRERVIKSGPYKDILSPGREVTAEERAILEKLVQDSLDQFVRVIVEGRGLPEPEVRRIADGRIVSGTEALRLKLVDEVGDEHRAVRLAAELAGLGGEPRVLLWEISQPNGLFGLFGVTSPTEKLEQLVPEAGVSVRYEWRGYP